MKTCLAIPFILILSGLLLAACAPTTVPFNVPSVSVPTFSVPSITMPTLTAPTLTVPGLKPPPIGITLVPGSASTPVPQDAPPSPNAVGGLGNAARLLFFGLIALIGVIVVIAMFVYYFRRRPDE